MKVGRVTIQDATTGEIDDLEYWYDLAGVSSGSTLGGELAAARADGLLGKALRGGAAVSYTHLTLPTICSV